MVTDLVKFTGSSLIGLSSSALLPLVPVVAASYVAKEVLQTGSDVAEVYILNDIKGTLGDIAEHLDTHLENIRFELYSHRGILTQEIGSNLELMSDTIANSRNELVNINTFLEELNNLINTSFHPSSTTSLLHEIANLTVKIEQYGYNRFAISTLE